MKASLLQGYFKIKQGFDTISKTNLTVELHTQQSLSSTQIPNSTSLQNAPMKPTDDDLMMDEADNTLYESMLLEASINAEQADILA